MKQRSFVILIFGALALLPALSPAALHYDINIEVIREEAA
jgi:hypothetical protein